MQLQPSLELSLSWAPEAFAPGNYIYVWLDGKNIPFYVGETSKSPSDRVGLHIRDRSRSGAVVAAIMADRKMLKQTYTVLAFAVPNEVLRKITNENNAPFDEATTKRARKALEFRVGTELLAKHSDLHRLRGASWTAASASEFVANVLEACHAKSAA